jgi:hypothetical protein
MPVVLVVVIAMAWIVILGPSFLKRRSQGGGGINSITHFHRQLRVLEQSGATPIMAPAYRLHAVGGDGDTRRGPGYPEVSAVPVLTVVGAKELPRPALAFLGAAPSDAATGRDLREDHTSAAGFGPAPSEEEWAPGTPARPHNAQARAHDSASRQLARRRRRDTLGVLAAVFAGSLLIGGITGAPMMWALCALAGAALVAYVALLVHLRRMAEEREHKLHYLRPDARGGPGTGRVTGSPYMSGRYAHPSNQAVVAR